MNMNKIFISGRLGSDAEVQPAGDLKVVKFSVASTQSRKVNGEWIDDTTWFECEAWKRESVAKYLKKGTHIVVEGRMKCDTYEKDGQKRRAWKVVVFQLDFVSPMIEDKQEEFKPKDDLPF